MKRLLHRLIAFFSLIRVQNAGALLVALVVVGKRIFQPNLSWSRFLWNEKFILYLAATVMVIIAGYIIDGFYNLRRDLINRPAKTLREQQLAMTHKLYLYFGLNMAAVITAFMISWRAALFFSVYIFLIWLYFHKWQFKPWFHEIFPAFLIMYPFFGLMLFFKQQNTFVIWAGLLVFITLIWKEMIKEFLTLKGDISQNFRTLLILKGESYIRYTALAGIIIWTAVWFGLYENSVSERLRMFLWILLGWMVFIWILFFRKKYPAAYVSIKIFIVAGIISVWLI